MRLLVRLIAFAAIMAAVALVGRSFLPSAEQTAVVAAPVPQVRVASRDLPVGTFLDEPEAPFTEWPDGIAEGMIAATTDPGRDVIGAVIIAPIKAGEPIQRKHLLQPGQDGFLAAVLGPGRRAVSVAVDAVSGNAGHIFPGDRIDLILTQTLTQRAALAGRPTERSASETILRDVRVIAVDQNLSSALTDRDAGRVARTITLEVLPADAEKVALASGLGKLSLSLRSLLIDEATLPRADAAGAGMLPDVAPPGPTWASDVSAVIRSAANLDTPPDQLPPPRTVRVFRGKKVDDGLN